MANTKITTNVIADGAITSAKLDTNITISGNITGTLATAAQPNITSVGSLTALTVDDITINGSTISDAGDLTLDVAGDIYLDAGGDDIYLSQGGTHFGQFKRNSSNYEIHSLLSDGDIVFKGNDGGSTVTALTLDMSDAGTAIFNHDIQMSDLSFLRMGAGGDLIAYSDGTHALINANNGNLSFDVAGDIVIDADGGDIYLNDGGTGRGQISMANTDLTIISATSDRDLIFKGVDGASVITALTLDMSDAGTAIFNHDIDLSGDIDASGQIFVGGQNSTFAENNLRFKSGGGAYIDHNTVGQDFIFRTSASSALDTTALTIQHDGNLLIGGTNPAPVSNNVVGISLRAANGEIQSSVNGAAALYLNRKTNDGDMAVFRKDGSDRGQIGTYGGTLYIGSVSGGIMFNGTDIEPTSGGTGRADNSIDLGSASYRFKDAFLGDGVYLGGTGAANKLDDYEEGTWTPTSGVNLTIHTTCRYTKIGNHLTLTFDFTYASNSDGNSAAINSLPFSYHSYNSGFCGWQNTNLSGPVMWHVAGNSAAAYNGKTNAVITYADASGKRVIGTITGIVA